MEEIKDDKVDFYIRSSVSKSEIKVRQITYRLWCNHHLQDLSSLYHSHVLCALLTSLTYLNVLHVSNMYAGFVWRGILQSLMLNKPRVLLVEKLISNIETLSRPLQDGLRSISQRNGKRPITCRVKSIVSSSTRDCSSSNSKKLCTLWSTSQVWPPKLR